MRVLLPAVLAVVSLWSSAPRADDVAPEAVVAHYADLAAAGYQDALTSALALQQAIDALAAQPSDDTLAAARRAWIAAREPYLQTEAFRFGNPLVDAWEPRVNAWPLDEGMIDYVDDSYGDASDSNPHYLANVIAQPRLKVGGQDVDATAITPRLLAETLHELGGSEANVASGYHAIEFLLWGQDLQRAKPGAGQRPATDFDVAHCTGGHCDRRVAYLRAATTLLVDDLREMVSLWQPDGAARAKLSAADPAIALGAMFTGMGSLSYGELAGERMKLGLMLHDSEEEQDCFSDNTHNAHFFSLQGIRNVYRGEYRRLDGTRLSGPSVAALVAQRDAGVDAELQKALDASSAALAAIRERGANGEPYDQLIADGNAAGNALVQRGIDALIAQTRMLERAVAVLDLSGVHIEGSDSIDDEVFQ